MGIGRSLEPKCFGGGGEEVMKGFVRIGCLGRVLGGCVPDIKAR